MFWESLVRFMLKVWEQFLDIIINYKTEVLKLIFSMYKNLWSISVCQILF